MSFVPPDGAFELMRYRVNTKANVSAPIYCQSQVMFNDSQNTGYGRISITVGQKPTSSLIMPSKVTLEARHVKLIRAAIILAYVHRS